MTQQDMLFDLDLGMALKKMGLESASDARSDVLRLCREYCRRAALASPQRLSCADDAYRGLVLAGLSPDLLGPAAGGLFRDGNWERTSVEIPSNRTSNHGRYIRMWRLKTPEHDIAASNARQNEYWTRQGGHPPPGYQDSDESPMDGEEYWNAPQDPGHSKMMKWGRK